MEMASRSSMGFHEDDDEDEDEFGRRDGSFQEVDLTGKVDGKNSGQNQPSTPRSKHSATEQRRRSKINDRFQILRDLMPHSDQKRDKATFLLEVIEYIRFLQEKVQKYESCPEMPWVKTFFRSLWKNAQNSTQSCGDGITDPQLATKNCPAPPGYMLSGNDNNMSILPEMLTNLQDPAESDPNLFTSIGRGTGLTQHQQRLVSDSDNMGSQSQSLWHRQHCPVDCRQQCPVDCTVSSDMLDEHEELTIDEGTVSVSNTYSQGLLATLAQSMESSGLDLSQASISVQIILGKRAKRSAMITSSAKDHDDPSANRATGQSMVESSGEESEQASKRPRSYIS
ncbi:transcription factor BIM2-like isoform X1 [Iris pallida]|uniref:Transcription factor BIM2-like isoform X1 n=1 Tax=Iris pallida TaxID=29817 RepID=A0AAX6EFB4_IRIPA|nr:transcription factor BIM2-like isoform X1 [Iris pallida]